MTQNNLALFAVYYYLFEYKSDVRKNTKNIEEKYEDLKNCLRNKLKVRTELEGSIIYCLRSYSKKELKREAFFKFPILRKRKNRPERIKLINQLLKELKSEVQDV